MVRKKDVNKDGLKSKLSADAQKDGWGSGINIRVKEFPAVLLELKEIKDWISNLSTQLIYLMKYQRLKSDR